MPGPALNPIANTAPVASLKTATGTRTDASADAGKTEAPEQGFATELKRQMRGESSADEAASGDAKAAAASDEAAKPTDDTAQDQAPTAPADLSALLAGAIAVSNQPAQLPRTPTADSVKGAIDTATTLSVDDGDTGKPGKGLADLSVDAANLAARHAPTAGQDAATGTAGNKLPPPDLAGTDAITSNRRSPETGADAAAAPTNNFAAIHAAALANMRGESAQPVASPVPLHVATPAGAPGWPEEVGNRVSWMVGQSESHAELTLTPPQLGKVEVSITISGDQTSAQIVAATPAARELIEQSLPRLREVLERSGINLGQTDVGTSGQPGGSGEGRRGGQFNPSRGGSDVSVGSTTAGPWLRRAEGLVDTFA